jgi:hypothetical protein
VRVRATTKQARVVHPIALIFGRRGWSLVDALDEARPLALDDCGDINLSGLHFD